MIRGPKYRIKFDKKKDKRKNRDYSIQELDLAYKQGGDLGSLSKSRKPKGIAKYKTVRDLGGIKVFLIRGCIRRRNA